MHQHWKGIKVSFVWYSHKTFRHHDEIVFSFAANTDMAYGIDKLLTFLCISGFHAVNEFFNPDHISFSLLLVERAYDSGSSTDMIPVVKHERQNFSRIRLWVPSFRKKVIK